ncbi:follitropin subunit beta [Ambystoma mexicanum]|uniref:follitropin subunit beta n=1 Tax=Ambystoma mexicanum TaxID=8296 RepID=UPI0037E7812A
MNMIIHGALLLCCSVVCCSMCSLSNITIVLEKEECGLCFEVNATWCSGYCNTQEPIIKNPLVPYLQSSCTAKEIVYKKVKIPGCSAGIAESLHSYPVATDCHCGVCDTDHTDCTVRGLGPNYCTFGQKQ